MPSPALLDEAEAEAEGAEMSVKRCLSLCATIDWISESVTCSLRSLCHASCLGMGDFGQRGKGGRVGMVWRGERRGEDEGARGGGGGEERRRGREANLRLEEGLTRSATLAYPCASSLMPSFSAPCRSTKLMAFETVTSRGSGPPPWPPRRSRGDMMVVVVMCGLQVRSRLCLSIFGFRFVVRWIAGKGFSHKVKALFI